MTQKWAKIFSLHAIGLLFEKQCADFCAPRKEREEEEVINSNITLHLAKNTLVVSTWPSFCSSKLRQEQFSRSNEKSSCLQHIRLKGPGWMRICTNTVHDSYQKSCLKCFNDSLGTGDMTSGAMWLLVILLKQTRESILFQLSVWLISVQIKDSWNEKTLISQQVSWYYEAHISELKSSRDTQYYTQT